MDLWVVAATAGAGYIAKNLQNLSADGKQSPSEPLYKYSHNIQSEPKNFLQQLRDKTCPLRRLVQKRAQSDDFLELKNHSAVKFSEVDRISGRNTESEPASTSIDALERNGMDGDYNMGWISSLPSAFSSEEHLKFEDGESRNLSRVNEGKIIRSKGCPLHPLRLLSSRGSCVDLQLYKEHENMEDISCLHPLMLRSFSLEQFESVDELQSKQQKCSADFESTGSGEGGSGRSFGLQEPGSILLFMTGMTVGILSATTSWKNEVDKLNKQLQQMQNLVQDLHEELDMKEVLMVEELTDEGHQEINTPCSVQEPIASPSDVKSNKLTKFDSLKANDKNIENLELLSKIEAELQAELEMLELNMKTSALEIISTVVEVRHL
ncbi:hypothetical protein CDL12_25193 [Handroanthus impetiginosus]|uniref:Uncharacterized protein n=1 Tax=Handroanthus impetiginosus TaxID=429701 RepID=A0A2G9GAG3_9LAMI|nr:hypothetical protein CDL12_25193 [Handroanthus impetiginosus]